MIPAHQIEKPTGASALFFIQIFSTLAYSVLYVTLVLFSVQALHLPASDANHLMATFVAFNFTLHLIGGFLGGRYISFRGLFLLGLILQIIGCLFIAKVNMPDFMLGMAFFLAGSGMDLPCINCMIAQLYEPEDKRKEYAFLWNYSGMNIGFFIGITVAGIFQSHQKFELLFIFTAITNIIAIILLLIHWNKLRDIKTVLSENPEFRFYRGLAAVSFIGIIIFILHYIFINALFTSGIILLIGILMMTIILTLTLKREHKSEKNKLIAFCIFGLASLIFYTLYELIPMALTLFLDRNVDRHAFGFTIPTAWFLNINTVVVILGCPLLAYFSKKLRARGRLVETPHFFSAGLCLIGLAIIILPLGIMHADKTGLVPAYFPVMTYLLLALAEISLSPIGYSLVGELAPKDLRGLLMGCWLMISGVAAIISNIFSTIALGPTQSPSPVISNSSYSHTFFILGISGIAMGILLWFIKPVLSKLVK